MVAPAPNLTVLEGVVRDRTASRSFTGWDDVELELVAVEEVPGVASRVRARPGDRVTVAVRPELLGAGGPGDRVRCRVALTPRGLRCEPYPAPGAFQTRTTHVDDGGARTGSGSGEE